MFEIVCPNRLHPLIAETEAEKIGWVADLEAVIADLVTAHPEAKNERGTSGWKRKKFLGPSLVSLPPPPPSLCLSAMPWFSV